MRAEDKKQIKIGSIVQIVPTEDHGHALKLLVVTKKESWGVQGTLPNGESVGRPWDKIEPTGGIVAFDEKGSRFSQPEEAPKHHE